MSISAPFIARPIATCLLSVAVLLGGALGYRALPVSALPQVDFPTIVVSTQYPGAGPDTMATLVTAPLEHQLGQINGIVSMQSSSAVGSSEITLQFDLTRSMEGASQDVQAAISQSQGVLPSTLPYPPTYNRVNPADAPVVSIALTSDTLPVDQVADAADTYLQPKLSQIDGVGRVVVQGGLKPAIRLRLDPARLAAYGLSMEDVRTAVAAANVSGAKGLFDGPKLSYAVGTNDQLLTPEAYKNLIIAWRTPSAVRLSDVGTVVHGVENDRVAAWYQGKPAVLLDVQRQPGANIVKTVDEVRSELTDLQKGLPPGIKLQISADRTATIRASVDDVQGTLLLAMVLVVGVIFLFLRSWRATLIPAVALPLSLVGTFGIMSWLGYGLDNLSLMALTVASGFVVDDAIVMIENVVRYVEAGMTRRSQAAYKSARQQIGFTIVSAHRLPGRGLHPPALHGRRGRPAVQRICRHPLGRRHRLRGGVPHPHAHDVRPPADAARQGGAREEARAHRPRSFTRLLDGYTGAAWCFPCAITVSVLLIAAATLAGTIILYIVIPKGFLPQQDTGAIVATTEGAHRTSPFPR